MKKLNFRGFTLIELLVVVLIIAILAAIALPKYEFAVNKSKYHAIMPIVKAIKEAQERFYMASGDYTSNWSLLDVTIPGGGTWDSPNQISYPNGNIFKAVSSLSGSSAGGGVAGYVHIGGKNVYYAIQFDHSKGPGIIRCGGDEDFCQKLGGTLIYADGNRSYQLNN